LPDAVKATIAAHASPYGLGLRDDGRSLSGPGGGGQFSTGATVNRPRGLHARPGGPLFNRRKWSTFRPALTDFAHAPRDYYTPNTSASRTHG
jgi:hypothetical protein